ncbi:MAG: ShET2/EspL2 family type secretion system effector toxin [Solimicrobium sp.]|nr:ShET2/EspL2 family type secretion system effector toxin [Solimicrobium sp.]
MELGSFNNHIQVQTGFVPTQTIKTLQEKVEVELNSMGMRWHYSTGEREVIKQCFLKMWLIDNAKESTDALARKQLSLLKDMDNYPELRKACFELMLVNSSGCIENLFPLFLELQEKSRRNITDPSTVSLFPQQLLGQPHHINLDSYRALQTRLKTEFGWHGRTYNKNAPLPAELALKYKGQPYISVTGISLLGLNDEVCFLPQKTDDPTTKKIVCRHFAIQLIKDVLEDRSGNGKINLALYSNRNSIAQHIPIEIEATCTTLIDNAKRYDLIDNEKLGQHLCACFGDMRSPEKQETLRVLLLESTFHSMVLRLRIKGTKENAIYVVTFYDPNKTTMAVRCETKELFTLKNYSLKQFINGPGSKEPGFYEEYYDEVAPISLLMECNESSLTESIIKKKKVLENFTPSKLTSTYIFFLLSGNFAHDLAGLRNSLQKIVKSSPKELFNLLGAKIADGTPGLYLALQNGHADVIEAYGELCQLFPKNARGNLVALLAAKKADGTPGLFMALQNGRADAVKAYGKLFQLLPKTELSNLVDLLTAKNAEGTPGLFIALQNGHADTIKEYGKLLQVVLHNEHVKLINILAAKKANGIPGLYMALQYGHAHAVKAYGEILRQLFPKTEYVKLVDVLASKKANGIPGLFMALHNGHAEAVKAYGEMCQLFPDIGDTKLFVLLAAKDEGGVPGLLMALHNGHVDISKTYRELLQQLPEKKREQLFDLLESTDADTTPWLYEQLSSGNEEVIKDHKNLLQLVSKWRAEFGT